MGMSGISRSEISRLCATIDERVQAFLHRPIGGGWPYLWFGTNYLKMCEAICIVSIAARIATGADSDARREVPSMQAGPPEAEPFWTEFLRNLALETLANLGEILPIRLPAVAS